MRLHAEVHRGGGAAWCWPEPVLYRGCQEAYDLYVGDSG